MKRAIMAFGGLAMLVLLEAALATEPVPPADKGKVAVVCFANFRNADHQNEIQFNTSLTPLLEGMLQEDGFTIHTAGNPPIVSKEVLQYTLVENSGLAGSDAKTGRLYLEIGGDGSAKVESESGIPAYTTMEIHSVEWMLDRDKAFDLLKGSGCRYGLLVSATAEDITAGISNNVQLSGQRSVRAMLTMSLVELSEKTTYKSFADESSAMDASGVRAANKGWKGLAKRAFDEWFKP